MVAGKLGDEYAGERNGATEKVILCGNITAFQPGFKIESLRQNGRSCKRFIMDRFFYALENIREVGAEFWIVMIESAEFPQIAISLATKLQKETSPGRQSIQIHRELSPCGLLL